MKNGVRIDGAIYSDKESLVLEEFNDKFIKFIEMHGLNASVTMAPINEHGEDIKPLKINLNGVVFKKIDDITIGIYKDEKFIKKINYPAATEKEFKHSANWYFVHCM